MTHQFDYGMLVVNLLLIDSDSDLLAVPWSQVFQASFAKKDIN